MKKIILILTFTLLLASCGNKEEYHHGFPNETSPALEQFIKDYTSSGIAYHLATDNDQEIYALANRSDDSNTVEYIQFTDKQLKDFYAYLLDSADLEVDIFELRERVESSLYEPLEDTAAYHLPEVTMEEGHILNVKTNLDEKKFNLLEVLEEYNVTENSSIIFNVIAVNADSFQMNIEIWEDGSPETDLSMFITQDLENILATKTYTGEFLDNIETANVELYEDLFVKLGTGEQYFAPVDTRSKIVDAKENELKEIDEADQLSKDNKYVYVGGNEKTLEEGTQQIQKTEDYLEGNEEYYAEFELDYDEIAEELDFKSAGIGISDIVYFNEDYIILRLAYDAPFTGTAGSTNVIIDLQEDKSNPTYYLVDLDIKI